MPRPASARSEDGATLPLSTARRVDWESDKDPAEWSARFTSSKNEELTPLARSVLSGASAAQHRDALGEADCARMAIMAEVPLEELQVRCLTPTPPGPLPTPDGPGRNTAPLR